MTKVKKTLDRNWTRYHNHYSMTQELEDACKDSLSWSAEMVRQYTIDHAHEVNQPMATKWAQHLSCS